MNIRIKRWLWRLGVLAVLVATAVPLGVGRWQSLVGGVNGSRAAASDMRAAPCLPGHAVALLDSPHVSAEQAKSVQYDSTPPTSGPHFGFTVAPGIYDTSIPDGLTVHALEHGHVAVQYAPDTPVSVIAKLESVAKSYPADVVLAPYERLPHGIAATAWGRIDLLDDFDEARIRTFIEQLRGRYEHGWTRTDGC